MFAQLFAMAMLCTGSFHNYNGEQPEQATFLLDRWTGKVSYAGPTSANLYLTPRFDPVEITGRE
jgi:hypothetical protein